MQLKSKQEEKKQLGLDEESGGQSPNQVPLVANTMLGSLAMPSTRRPRSNFAFCATLSVMCFVLLFFVVTFFHPSKPFRVTFFFKSYELEASDGANVIVHEAGTTTSPGKARIRDAPQCANVSVDSRFDCFPEKSSNDLTEMDCLGRGCCWKPVPSSNQDHQLSGVPYCYYPSNYDGYSAIYTIFSENKIQSVLQRNHPSGLPFDPPIVIMNCTFLSENVLRIKFYDPIAERYEVPIPEIQQPPVSSKHNYMARIGRKFEIYRPDTETVLFSVNLATLVFSDQFIQVSLDLPSKYVYGIGESKDKLMRDINWKRYVLFNRDRVPVENANTYGSHPFYMAMEEDGRSSGVFLFNSNAMEVLLQPAPAITFRPIGGILDFYVMTGPTPGDVVAQYTSLIGRTFMPPYWSLGFHLCRFGYKSVEDTRAVWNRTRSAGIPFDTQWNDIDYMDRRNDFTLNRANYSTLPSFVKEVHDAGMHYVMIVDPGISNTEAKGTYPPFDDGLVQDVFVKNSSGQLFIGKVWNSVSTVFPDFTHPNASAYWTKQFKDFHDLVPFDGAWIDMNEPSNFYNGMKDGCPQNKFDYPYYTPGGFESIFTKTLCMSAVQHASIHYNVHNLYGLTETIATNVALRSILQKRPFIISRSTFPGQGHYGGHWDGDINSDWNNMAWTIPSMLTMNMFGISMVGADICGFNSNTTVELCARWSELGAFYPFSRNHNTDNAIDQDPVALGPDVVESAKMALTMRYYGIPYLYTLFYRSHVFGETVVRPLFFEFSSDKKTYSIDTQFMWGSGAMIVPVLEQNATQVTGYFPTGVWYDPHAVEKPLYSTGQEVVLDAPLTKINVFLRGGAIVPAQVPGSTTTDSRKNPFYLIVALDADKKACGELYWDDGESLETYEAGKYNLIQFLAENSTVTSKIEKNGYEGEEMVLALIQVLGIDKAPKKVTLNGTEVKFYYEKDLQLLGMQGVSLSLLSAFTLEWTY